MDEHDTAQADGTHADDALDAAQPGAADPHAPIEHELDVAVSRTRAWDAYVHGLEEWWHPSWTRFGTGIDRIQHLADQRPAARRHARELRARRLERLERA